MVGRGRTLCINRVILPRFMTADSYRPGKNCPTQPTRPAHVASTRRTPSVSTVIHLPGAWIFGRQYLFHYLLLLHSQAYSNSRKRKAQSQPSDAHSCKARLTIAFGPPSQTVVTPELSLVNAPFLSTAGKLQLPQVSDRSKMQLV